MNDIQQLQPAAVWRNFYLLTRVPRPSGHLAQIQQFLLDWAREKGVEASMDGAGNILMRKPATPGMEDRKTVTLQAHMDMVPQKTKESTHNFETDPIDTYVDGEWVKARGTTLGSDDGMGVAAIMAVMEDSTLRHGPLEGFITADEESTMGGVNGMAADTLQGQILLNLDNETEGDMIIGSAGGVNLTATMEYRETDVEAGDVAVKVVLGGLRGGHSGLEINEGRANANKLMGRLVRDVAEFKLAVADWAETFKDEYGVVETALSLTCVETELPAHLVPEEIQDNLVDAICACHNGVMRFIPAIPSIVETSSNLAIVEIGGGKAMFKALIRSSCDSQRENCAETLESAFAMAGMRVELDGDYPAWQPNPDSEIVALMKDVYRDLFDAENNVQVVHAGLECGVIGAKYPAMDMVSFGPTLRSPHTPDERCHIPSVDKYWRFVVATLERIPKK